VERLILHHPSPRASGTIPSGASASLDQPADFSYEVLAEWRADKQEQFGPRWPEVQAILRFLEGFGVFMLDVNPGNISYVDPGREQLEGR
jgi:hypothetical protein